MNRYVEVLTGNLKYVESDTRTYVLVIIFLVYSFNTISYIIIVVIIFLRI